MLRRCYTTATQSSKDQLLDALRAVRQSFPDKHDLHSRIDLALSTDKIRIGIIPFHCRRTDIHNAIEAVLADPLSSEHPKWYPQFQTRLLAKDGLVKYSPSFDHVLTHNSLVEFPVPFRQDTHREVEILEANSFKDSWDHLKRCHFHVFISTDPQKALTNQLPSTYPSALILDMHHAPDPNFPNSISSSMAQRGISLLAESPANATEYSELYKQSHIELLEKQVFQPAGRVERNLLESVVATCGKVIVPQDAALVDRESQTIKHLREEWGRHAHQELQTTLSNGINSLSRKELAWWKLYYKVDDVHDAVSMRLPQYWFPQAKPQLDYLLGRIDSFANAPQSAPTTSFHAALTNILATNAVTLHNSALKQLVTVLFGMQLPTTIIPLLGVYFYDYSWYAMGSVIGLGMVLGARQLANSWAKSFAEFKRSVMEQARTLLNRSEKSVWERWEAKVVTRQQDIESQQAKLTHLQGCIDKSYSDSM